LILSLQSQNANVDLLNAFVAAKTEGLRMMASQKCLFNGSEMQLQLS